MSESNSSAEKPAKKQPSKKDLESDNAALKAQIAEMTANINKESETSKEGPRRIMKGEEVVYHDLYRLEVANATKDISWQADVYSPVPVAHVHHYHSVDSDGKAHDKSCSIGGHFHFVYPTTDENGDMVATCSEPHKIVRNKKTGKRSVVKCLIRRARDEEGDIVKTYDKHLHDVTYLRSEKLVKRVFNEDALKEISRIEAEKAKRMKNPCL